MVGAELVVDAVDHMLTNSKDADMTEYFAGEITSAEQFLVAMKKFSQCMKTKKGKDM